MLKKYFDYIDMKDCNYNISNSLLGVRLDIAGTNKRTITDLNLKSILSLNKIDFTYIQKDYKKVLDTLGIKNNIDYISLLGRDKIVSKFNNFKNLTNRKITTYPFDILPIRQELTKNISTTKMFIDGDNIELKKPIYNHVKSVTGRMTIVDGYNFLIAKKDLRNKIVPNKNNVIIELDVRSCEPSLLHSLLYDKEVEDIYENFLDKQRNKISRSKIKLAVISSLYGSSIAKASKISGAEKQLIIDVRNHFKIDKINKNLKEEFSKNNFILNMYGRPIYEINAPLNYWLQSTAADYCCLAFYNLVKKYDLDVKAVIHDAIIIETSRDNLDKIMNIKKIHDPLSRISLNINKTILS